MRAGRHDADAGAGPRGGGVAEAQTAASTLVSNTAQTEHGGTVFIGGSQLSDAAATFTTGDHASGYTLSEVGLKLASGSHSNAFDVAVWTTTASGVPDSQLHALTKPGSLTSDALNVFTAPAGATLDANTTYAVVLDFTGTSGDTNFRHTASTDEDSGAASGWSIGDGRLWKRGSDTSWNSSGSVFVMEVKGSAIEGPEVSSASVDGTSLEITFDEDLDATSKPGGGAFYVARREFFVDVTAVDIADATVTLTLAEAILAGESVLVYYTAPSSGALQNAAGQRTVSFARQAVTNNTGTGTPSISSVSVVSKPRHDAGSDGSKETYPVDQPIVVEVTWDQDVAWDVSASGAQLRVPLAVGANTRHATLVTDGQTSGTARSLRFSYTVVAGDTDTDGLEVTATGGNVVVLASGATLTNAAGTGNAGRAHAGLGAQANHKVDGSQSAVANTAPTFTPDDGETTLGDLNAPPLTLVNRPVVSHFSDADGDPLWLTFSHPNDVYVVGGPSLTIGRLFMRTRPHCTLTNLAGVTSTHREPITVTVTDPDGASVSTTLTTITTFSCPQFSAAEVTGDTLTLTLTKALQDLNTDYSAHTRRAPTAEVLAPHEFTVTAAGNPITVEAVTVDGATATLTLAQAVPVGAAVTLGYTPGDHAAAVAFTGQAVTNNTAGVQAAVDAGDGTVVTLTFSESLMAPKASVQYGMRHGFVVQGGYWLGVPIRNQSPNGVAIDGTTVTLTLGAPIPVGGEATVSYDPQIAASYGGTLRDTTGTDLDSFTVVATRPGSAPPTLTRAVVEGAVLALVFDQELDATSAPAGSRFELSVSDSSTLIQGTGTAAVSGTRVRVALASAPAAGSSATLFYEKGSDANPLRASSSGPQADDILGMLVYPAATAVPALDSSVVAGTKAVLYYHEELDPGSTPAASAFTVTAGGSAVTVSGVAVSDSSVVLTLGSSVAASTTVTATYTAGTNPIQDLAGNDAANLTSRTLTNRGPADAGTPTLTGASVQRRALTLSFDQELDPAEVPAASAFTTSDPWWSVERVEVRGSDLQLRLNDAVGPCSPRFTVSYTVPAAGALANLWGTAADTLSDQTVTYGGTGTCAYAWDNSWTGSIVLSATRPFDTSFEPQPEWFTVTASGGPVTVTAAEISPDDAHLLVLSVSREFDADETITVSYRRPRGSAGLWTVDGDQLADLSGMEVENRVERPQNEAPVFRGRSRQLDNALPGFLVSLPLRQSDFSDPDGDPLTFTLTASRDDVFARLPHMGLPDGFLHNERLGRVFFLAKTSCALGQLPPPSGDAFYTVFTMTATDPDGLSATATATFRTDPATFACPSPATASVDGAVVTLTFDANLAPSYADPQAGDFTVTVDGAAVAVTDAVSAPTDVWSDTSNTITLTLASAVWGGQDVTVSYTPANSPIAAAFAGWPAVNYSPAPPEPQRARQLEQPEETEESGEADESEEPEEAEKPDETEEPEEAEETAEPEAPEAPVCTPDPSGPMVPVCAAVSGDQLTLTFNRDLAPIDNATARALRHYFLIEGAFDRNGTPTTQSPSQVAVAANTVTLTLGTPVRAGDEVTVTCYGGLHSTDRTPMADFTVTLTTTQRD